MIEIATTVEQIRRCHEVMRELRPHLSLDAFVEQVERQQRAEGYHLASLSSGDRVRCVAGYRVQEMLAHGRFLYVDDLVTRSEDHGSGHGARLFQWLIAQAQAAGCAQLQLDSGVQRFGAHAFYFRQRMKITSHHFAMNLPAR